MHTFLQVLPKPRWQDVVDILIVAYMIYRIALLIRGTRTMQMVFGIAVIGIAFIASQLVGLFTLNWLLNNFLGSAIIILVVIFQADIRRALTGVGARSFFVTPKRVAGIAQELASSAEWLSARRIGALIVIEREVGLQDVAETGRLIDGRVSPEMLETIFMRGSPLHDGAVIIKGDRIVAAGCLLPLTTNPNVSLKLGTRHRAAIGLTEDNDAVVVVVSEEDGTISLARQGALERGLKAEQLLMSLRELPG
ncbi:MAG TPA: diadenylate cyclase CdaA [Candidatus Binataceae bacterium]|nr:diadenylate cyclase CdaA [Candidatus Binataceae bacterium]